MNATKLFNFFCSSIFVRFVQNTLMRLVGWGLVRVRRSGVGHLCGTASVTPTAIRDVGWVIIVMQLLPEFIEMQAAKKSVSESNTSQEDGTDNTE